MNDAMVWHRDGHLVTLELNKSELQVTEIRCPHNEALDAPCRHDETPCVVKWFLKTFGMECNVGVASPSAEMEFAWHFVGTKHQELGSCQVWVIPVADEAFSAWMVTQQ
jgi:hypothetical protein